MHNMTPLSLLYNNGLWAIHVQIFNYGFKKQLLSRCIMLCGQLGIK